jgi:ketosteroid isomerase-like protein
VRGWDEVAKASDRAASQARDGELVSVEIVGKHVTPELAYVVEIERAKAKIGGSEDITPFDLRVTMIFRPEEGEWKVVHRHADPITTAQPAESAIALPLERTSQNSGKRKFAESTFCWIYAVCTRDDR